MMKLAWNKITKLNTLHRNNLRIKGTRLTLVFPLEREMAEDGYAINFQFLNLRTINKAKRLFILVFFL